MTTRERLKELGQLDAEITILETQLKAKKEIAENLSWELSQEMEQQGIDSMKIDGINFIKAQRVFAKVEDPVTFNDWVRENDMWATTHMISAQKINGYCKELMAQQADIPPGVNPNHVKHYVQIRRT